MKLIVLYSFLSLALLVGVPSYASQCKKVFTQSKTSQNTKVRDIKFSQFLSEIENTKLLKQLKAIQNDASKYQKAEKLFSKYISEGKSNPYALEMLAIKLMSLSEKANGDGFFKSLITSMKTPSEKNFKKVLEVRLQQLLLNQELVRFSNHYGVKVVGSIRSKLRGFMSRHILAQELLLSTTKNAIAITVFGFPVDFPDFYKVNNRVFSLEIIKVYGESGIKAAYPLVVEQAHPWLIKIKKGTHNISRVTSAVFLSAMIGFTGYATYKVAGYGYTLYGYMQDGNFSNILFIRDSFKLTDPIFADYVEWKRVEYGEAVQIYVPKEGESALHPIVRDMLTSKLDLEGWYIYLDSIYISWSHWFVSENGRKPDLSKLEDQLEWQKFVDYANDQAAGNLDVAQ